MKGISSFTILFVILIAAGTNFAQDKKFNRQNYFDYLTSPPKIISQTEASARLNLYGDIKNDGARIDGVEDKRDSLLLRIAAKFSPILRKNNFSAPRNFETMLTLENQPFLYIDTWDIARDTTRRVHSDSINLQLLKNYEEMTAKNGHALSEAEEHDLKLLKLIKEFYPDSSRIQHIRPEKVLTKVLFFNFAGSGEKNWKKTYKDLEKRKDVRGKDVMNRIYAHPFIYEDTTATGPARYELVMQYWFFYPFNDGGNNHEGDWEHLNVRITTLEKRGELLTAEDIGRILDHTNPAMFDSLVIKKVDYYFHHYVMTLDYQRMNFLQDFSSFKKALRGVEETKFFQNWINEQIYNRVNLVKDTINTHPIAFIGADNQGLDQIFALPGGKNRNSHGMYPFIGIWKNVGPLGATEKVTGGRTFRFLLPPISKLDKLPRAVFSPGVKNYKPVNDPNYLTYSMEDIELVPDWERIKKLVTENPSARRTWFWLILPTRWGFPVMESPGAGFIKNADMGNAAPIGPAFNSAWNRVGPSAGYQNYDPNVLPSEVQISVQDHFKNRLGFLNVTYPLWKNLPMLNLAWFLLPARFEYNPKFITQEELPFRFGSMAFRPFYTFGDDDFASVLPQRDNPTIRSFLEAHGGNINSASLKHENNSGYVGLMFNLHLGRLVAIENTFSDYTSDVRYAITNPAGGQIGTVQGKFNLTEFYSSFRYSPLYKNFQPFLRAGYGWSWYKASDITLNGEPLAESETEWFHNPTFPYLPNTFHVGGGFEVFPQRNFGAWRFPVFGTLFSIGKPEIGIRVEYTFLWHRLGDDVPADRRSGKIGRHEFAVALVIGF